MGPAHYTYYMSQGMQDGRLFMAAGEDKHVVLPIQQVKTTLMVLGGKDKHVLPVELVKMNT